LEDSSFTLTGLQNVSIQVEITLIDLLFVHEGGIWIKILFFLHLNYFCEHYGLDVSVILA
jgi:hypothetical protein